MTLTSYLRAVAASEAVPFCRVSRPETAASGRISALVRGTGSIGARHLRVLERLGVEDLFAMPVRAPASLTGRTDIPESVQLVDTYPDTELDLVVIATDTSRHVDDALEALERRPKALLLEKPVSPDAAAARILAAHPRAGTITVSAPLRFHQGLAVMAEVLPRMGRPSSAQVRSQSWLPDWRPSRDFRQSYSARAAEGGALRDLVHDIDYPVMLLGAPTSLRASLGHGILGIEAEEAADLLWGTNTAVHVRLDYVSPVKSRGVRVATVQGSLSWDVVRNEVVVEMPPLPGGADPVRDIMTFPDDNDTDTVLARQSLAVLERSGVSASSFMARFTPATLDDGILAVAICDAARTAHQSGAEEKVLL